VRNDSGTERRETGRGKSTACRGKKGKTSIWSRGKTLQGGGWGGLRGAKRQKEGLVPDRCSSPHRVSGEWSFCSHRGCVTGLHVVSPILVLFSGPVSNNRAALNKTGRINGETTVGIKRAHT